MFLPEMEYFPVTPCQGFGSEFSRLNSEKTQKSNQILLLVIFFVTLQKVCAPRLTPNNKSKNEVKS